MRLSGLMGLIGILAMLIISGGNTGEGGTVYEGGHGYSSAPGQVRHAGLWDKPNEACETECQIFVQKDCFKTLRDKNPTADPASLQDQCDDKYSVCLYKCMCENCKGDPNFNKVQ